MKECRHLLRDRHTLIYSIGIPLFLYPVLLFGLFQSLVVVKGWSDRQVTRLHFPQAPAFPYLRVLLDDVHGLDLVEAPGASGASAGDRETWEAWIRGGALDAVLAPADEETEAADGRFVLLYSGVDAASGRARDRCAEAIAQYRERVLLLRAEEIGEDASFLETIAIVEDDIASGERKANYLMSMTLPLLMVIIILMGAFYPALDATAGERERGTLETSLVAPVSRGTLVLGKYLAVVTLALVAFGLNFASMAVCFKYLIGSVKVQAFTISIPSLLLIFTGALLLALLVSALMMAVAFLARSFKEGQSYMAPIYLLGVAPILVALSPDVALTPVVACVPVVNITMVFRDVLQSRIDAWPIALSLATSSLYSALAIALASWLVSRESFVFGSGSPLSVWLSRRRRRDDR